MYVQVCLYFLSVCGVFKCTLYVCANTSVGAHACVRARDMCTHTRTLYRVVLEQNLTVTACECVCVRVCMCVFVCVSVCAHMCVMCKMFINNRTS